MSNRLEEAHIVYERKKIYIMGKTEPPVSWDFVMSVDAAEVGRLVRSFRQQARNSAHRTVCKDAAVQPKGTQDKVRGSDKNEDWSQTRPRVRPDAGKEEVTSASFTKVIR